MLQIQHAPEPGGEEVIQKATFVHIYIALYLREEELTKPEDVHARYYSSYPDGGHHGPGGIHELTLYERIMETSWNRFLFMLGMVVFGTVMVALNWKDIRKYFTGEVAEVASSALENQKLLTKSNELAIAVAKHLIENEATQEALTELVSDVLADKKTRDELIVLFSNLFQDPIILDEATVLSQKVTHRVLQDEKVNDHAQRVTAELFQKVLDEKQLQNQAGVALWNSIKYAIVPNWFGDYGSRTASPNTPTTEPPQYDEDPDIKMEIPASSSSEQQDEMTSAVSDEQTPPHTTEEAQVSESAVGDERTPLHATDEAQISESKEEQKADTEQPETKAPPLSNAEAELREAEIELEKMMEKEAELEAKKAEKQPGNVAGLEQADDFENLNT